MPKRETVLPPCECCERRSAATVIACSEEHIYFVCLQCAVAIKRLQEFCSTLGETPPENTE